MAKHINFEDLFNEYQSLLETAENFSKVINNEIRQGLEEENIQLGFPIQSRIKGWESIKEKLQRITLDIQTITDLQDFVGFRIILLFSRDVSIIERIISRRLKVVRQYNTKERLETNQFGYSSIHYVVALKNEHFTSHMPSLFSQLKAEIQVRTIAQHLWAEASHTLQYKQESSIPENISRDIHRIAALLETVDMDFEKVLKMRDDYRSGIINLNSDAPLNVDSLEITLDALWPTENKLDFENYSYLLSQLNRQGINSQSRLVEIIRRHRDAVLIRSAREAEHLRMIINNYPIENGRITIRSKNKVHTNSGITPDLISRVKKGIFYGHVALTGTALQFETGERSPLEPID